MSSRKHKKRHIWRGRRHLSQGLVLALFLFLPLPLFGPPEAKHGLLAVDFDLWRVYFFGLTLVPGLLHLIAMGIILCLFALTLSASLYSKVFCGWACPQNIFFELYEGIQKRLKKRFPSYRRSAKAQKTMELLLATAIAAGITATALSYFKGASPLFTVTLSLFLFSFFIYDTVFLKHNFCKFACPYAFLQKSMQDKSALHVAWEERLGNPCGTCTACVKTCYVGIDIKKQTYDIDCTHCGDCIDACSHVYSSKPEPPLLSFAFENNPATKRTHRFLGINSYRKGFLVIAFVLYIGIFGWMIIDRPTMNFRVFNPVGGSSKQEPFLLDGKHTARFLIRLKNLTNQTSSFSLGVSDPRFSLLWKSDSGAPEKVPPFGSLQSDVLLQWNVSNEEPPNLYPLQILLTEAGHSEPTATDTIYFRPARAASR